MHTARSLADRAAPAPQNVDFFATPSEAVERGYRPCLRCHPMDPNGHPPKLIERLRAEVERAPGGRLTDKELAALAIDPSTARRQFKRHYGMTFQAYHRARRMGLALSQVRQGGRVDEARNGSGFESESGFREAFTRIFGEPPTNAKTSAPLLAERIDTPLGPMIAVADDEGLRLLEFIDRRATERELSLLRKRLRTNVVPGKHRHREAVVRNWRIISRQKPGVRHPRRRLVGHSNWPGKFAIDPALNTSSPGWRTPRDENARPEAIRWRERT